MKREERAVCFYKNGSILLINAFSFFSAYQIKFNIQSSSNTKTDTTY